MPLEFAGNVPPAGVPTAVVRGGANPPLRTKSAPDAAPAARIIARPEKRRIKQVDGHRMKAFPTSAAATHSDAAAHPQADRSRCVAGVSGHDRIVEEWSSM